MTAPAKKRLGQHFLHDPGILARIVRFIAPRAGDCILEIGAGRGALSARLAPAAARLVAVELDRDCLEPLRSALAPFPSAEVVPGDIMAIDLDGLASGCPRGGGLRAVGNLPYNIATALIARLLDSRLDLEDLVFLVQLEVAQRITARPGTRQYGYFSVLCQHLADVTLGFSVSPGAFSPRPKVVSAMVRLEPKRERPAAPFEHAFRTITRAAFAYRRKTIANALARSPELAGRAEELLDSAGIARGRRAEELSVADYERLAARGGGILGNRG